LKGVNFQSKQQQKVIPTISNSQIDEISKNIEERIYENKIVEEQ